MHPLPRPNSTPPGIPFAASINSNGHATSSRARHLSSPAHVRLPSRRSRYAWPLPFFFACPFPFCFL
jgi:hypothetical protein